MENRVNRPAHYCDAPDALKAIGISECIDLVRDKTFCQGSAIKYVWRALVSTTLKRGEEGRIEDLQKALWYVRYLNGTWFIDNRSALAIKETRNSGYTAYLAAGIDIISALLVGDRIRAEEAILDVLGEKG